MNYRRGLKHFGLSPPHYSRISTAINTPILFIIAFSLIESVEKGLDAMGRRLPDTDPRRLCSWCVSCIYSQKHNGAFFNWVEKV